MSAVKDLGGSFEEGMIPVSVQLVVIVVVDESTAVAPEGIEALLCRAVILVCSEMPFAEHGCLVALIPEHFRDRVFGQGHV